MGALFRPIQLIATILISALQMALLVRAILSWIPDFEDSAIYSFVYTITEPLLIPMRMLFFKLNWFQQIPIDIAFLATALLLSFLAFIISGL